MIKNYKKHPYIIRLVEIPSYIENDSAAGVQDNDLLILQLNAGILIFDVTSEESYKNIPNHYKDVVRVLDNVPICLIGNKVDA